MQRVGIELGERSYDILIGSGIRKQVGEASKVQSLNLAGLSL